MGEAGARTLFDVVRHDPPRTSREARRSIERTAPTMADRVLAFVRARGARGCTDEEAELALGLRSQSYTPRRRELVQAGLVLDSGQRRATTSGRAAVVWVAVGGDG